MSTGGISEIHSCMNYKCETPHQLSNLHSCRNLNGPKMAPLVEEKNAGNDDLVVDCPEEQYTSTETNSSENNSDVQLDDEDSVNKLRNTPLTDRSSNTNGVVNQPFYQPNSLSNFFAMSDTIKEMTGAPNGLHNPVNSPVTGNKKLEFDGLYTCHKCDFVGRNDDELHEHAHRHDPYECGTCGFLADTPDNLKRHLKEEHPEIPASKRDEYILFHEPETIDSSPETIESSPETSESSPKKKTTKAKPFEENIDKPRKTTCRICKNFTGYSKMEYYDHLRDLHSETGKLLHCELCPFIALYKHHFEYHLRNHYGSKPYKCDRCDYACVNRSMLNSHYKSHSDVYQYSCENCSYMTKYLHSLKMHLRKYNHKPGRLLNPDGSINSNAIIDVHGKRRGPKSKKRKNETDRMQEDRESPKSKSSPSPPSTSFDPHPNQNIRIMYNPHIYNNYTGNLYVKSGLSEANNYMMHSPPSIAAATFRCGFCEFVTGSLEIYHSHLYSHGNQDRLSDGSFKPKYPDFLQQPYGFSIPTFGTILNPESVSRNIVNQSSAFERKNINESRSMGITNNGIHFQNSANKMNNYQPMENNRVNKQESFNGMAIRPEALPFNSQQLTKQRYRRRRESKTEKWLKSNTPSPNATLTVKEEIPEPMNGIFNPYMMHPIDNGPLDLTVKQPISPKTQSNKTPSPYRLLGGSISAPINRASSISPKFGNEESKATTQKTSRRKGKAFKLNQYTIESDPVSDGVETGFEKMRLLYESTYSNEARSKPAIGPEIKNSVPRSNFKSTLDMIQWNGLPLPKPTLPKLEPAYIEPNHTDSQTHRQRAWDSWCSYCDMDQGDASLLEMHSAYHSENDPFTCAKCGLRCEGKIRFLSHILSGSRINGTCINAIENCKS